MPGRDRTGPLGQGPGYGRGMGRGQGQGRGRFAAVPGGSCICPNCGNIIAHVVGQPCIEQSCPNCDARMTRNM